MVKRAKEMTIIKQDVSKKEVWALDSEDDQKGNLIVAVFYNGKDYFIFKNQYDIINFLLDLGEKKKQLYIACVNLEYDLINCFKGFYNYLEFKYSNHLIFARLKNTKIYFFDTLNHYKLSVKNQGKIIGKEKLKVDFKRLKDKFEETVAYCKRDTEITYEFVNFYQDVLNKLGADLKFTIASSSLNLYRRKFLRFTVKKIDDEILEEMSNAYYGGRTEIFTMKAEGDIYGYDVNSLYPSVMQKTYPNPNSIFTNKKSIDEEGVSYVSVKIKKHYIPYLPYRFENKLIFPYSDNLSGWWTNYELRFALENKLIELNKIYKSINFSMLCSPFNEYVNFLYDLRKKYKNKEDVESKFYSITLKLLMNSLYGKFAEKVEDTAVLTDEGEIIEIKIEDEYYPVHTNYIWSIYTTAYGRTRLWLGLNEVLSQGGQLLYCDTDSIYYKGKKGLLKEGKELGEWSFQGKFKRAEFLLPKTYLLEDDKGGIDIVAKGVPEDKQYEFFHKGMTEILRPIKFRESFRRKDDIRANVWIKQYKVLRSQYTKRKILKGGETEPLKI